jgi:hypothetical protein
MVISPVVDAGLVHDDGNANCGRHRTAVGRGSFKRVATLHYARERDELVLDAVALTGSDRDDRRVRVVEA